MGRELREGLRVVVDGDRDVLLGRPEFVSDLLVELGGEGRHGPTLAAAVAFTNGRRTRRAQGPELHSNRRLVP